MSTLRRAQHSRRHGVPLQGPESLGGKVRIQPSSGLQPTSNVVGIISDELLQECSCMLLRNPRNITRSLSMPTVSPQSKSACSSSRSCQGCTKEGRKEGRKRKEKEGKGRKRKEKEGKGRKRKEKEGKGRKRKEKEGKGRKHAPIVCFCCVSFLTTRKEKKNRKVQRDDQNHFMLSCTLLERSRAGLILAANTTRRIR